MSKLSDQQPPEKLCDGSMTGQLAESLFKRRKFLYIEMQDCPGFKLLSRQSAISSDSEQDAEVFGKEICVANLRKLSRRSLGMRRYIGMLRVETQKRAKINRALNEFRSMRKLSTEPVETTLNKTQDKVENCQPILNNIDVREFLKNKNTRQLTAKTKAKQKKLLSNHCKVSDFCRIAKRYTQQQAASSAIDKGRLPQLSTSQKLPKNEPSCQKNNIFFKSSRKN